VDLLTAGGLGERGLIRRLRKSLPGLAMTGDDCAVLPPLRSPVITVDTFLEGSHFHRWWAPPGILGRRLLEATLSDLASMGAHPVTVLAALELPPDTSVDWLLEFYRGLLSRESVTIAGGETVRSDRFGVTLTAIGEGHDPETLMRRSGLEPGDWIWVTGPIGRSLDAPELLERCGGLSGESLEPCRSGISSTEIEQVRAFLLPEAALDTGILLRSEGVRCAIDISDGLLSEAAHLAAESGVDVIIELDRVPLLEAVAERPLEASSAGEDFVLLFGAREGYAPGLPGCTRVGTAGRPGGVLRVLAGGVEVEAATTGYDHLEVERK